MIRELVIRQIGFADPPVRYLELAGLSSDPKPVDVVDAAVVTATGSTFLEVDTGNVYAYDEAGAEWHKIACGPAAEPAEAEGDEDP